MGCVNLLGHINPSVVNVLRRWWMWNCLTAALVSLQISTQATEILLLKQAVSLWQNQVQPLAWSQARTSSWLFCLYSFGVKIHLQSEKPFWGPRGPFCGRFLLVGSLIQRKCRLRPPASSENQYFLMMEEFRWHEAPLRCWIQSSSVKIDILGWTLTWYVATGMDKTQISMT